MARLELLGSRKFKRLARVLDSIAYGETEIRGFGQSLAAGSLELMWASCYAALDDVLGTPEDVETAAEWNGEQGALFMALRDAGLPDRIGFIEECPDRPGVWRVHDLWDHAPDYVGRQLKRKLEREQNGETISALRAAAGRKGGLQRAANFQANGKQAAVTCLANVATHDVKGGEKKGEKLRAEPVEAPASAPAPLDLLPPAPPSPVVAEVPCLKGEVYRITEAKVREWQEAYPGIDVMREVRALVQWCRDNSTRRKTLRGSPAFFSRCLSKKQDRNPNPRPQREQTSAHDAELKRALAAAEADYRSGKYGAPANDASGCGAGGAGGGGESDPAADDVASVGTSLSAAIGTPVVRRR